MLSPVIAETEELDLVRCISLFQILVMMSFLNKAVQRRGISRGSSQTILEHSQDRQTFQDTGYLFLKLT